MSLTEVALSTHPPTHPPHPSTIPPPQHHPPPCTSSLLFAGWMLGNRKKAATEQRRAESASVWGWSTNQVGVGVVRGRGALNGWDSALGMLMRQGTFCLSGSSECSSRGCVGDLCSACPRSSGAQAALKIGCLHCFTCAAARADPFPGPAEADGASAAS